MAHFMAQNWRIEKMTQEQTMLGNLVFDLEKRMLSGARGSIVLPPRAFAVLKCLARRPGTVKETSELISAMYHPDDEPETAYVVLRTTMTHLRSIVEMLGDGRIKIRAEPGIGYALSVRRD